MKRQPVDFIFLEWGFATDCAKGPAFVEKRSYLGFDCLRSQQGGPQLYRYTKKSSWYEGCGLECFVSEPLEQAEASYKSEYRSGYIDGTIAVTTYYRGVVNKEQEGEKLFFQDHVLWSSEEMGYARDYTFFQYGNGWAKLLGMASGSAPALSCGTRFLNVDPREVFPPKAGG